MPAAGGYVQRVADRQPRFLGGAIEKMRGEIRYHLELCPCTGETYQHVDIELAAS